MRNTCPDMEEWLVVTAINSVVPDMNQVLNRTHTWCRVLWSDGGLLGLTDASRSAGQCSKRRRVDLLVVYQICSVETRDYVVF